MKVIGLAGPAGSGKSAVARELSRRAGVDFLDLDCLAWSTYEPGTPTFNALVVRFGVGILTSEGRIDRARLAERAFVDAAGKRDLNRIVHPAVNEALARRIEQEKQVGCEILIVEGALLGTSPDVDRSLFDAIVWLEALPERRATRLAYAGRSHHAERNADIAPPPHVIRVNADAALHCVAEDVWHVIETETG